MNILLKIGIISFCLFTINGYAQVCTIENIIFEGAGIRGIAYAGVIKELENQGKLRSIKNVGGTSAGAITALMVSLGYSAGEIEEIISSTKFRRFNDGRFFFIGGSIRTNNKFGWYRGEKFTRWIANIIEDKTGDPDITFEELNNRGFTNLYVTATSLNQQKLIILSKETYPQMKVKHAIRISMSIPLYFKAVFVDSTGKIYRKNNPEALDIMVDGGIIGNFPISIFDSLRKDPANDHLRVANQYTVGIRIDSEPQIKNDKKSQELVPLDIKNFNDYISALYKFVIENLNRNELTDEDWARTISISSEGISPRIRRLSKDEKEKLIRSGQIYTAEYLKTICK
ncbi:MAG: patatin-like phospholipase family protein [Candidatus Cyclobacteriaceae bacterium M2_1C_046]